MPNPLTLEQTFPIAEAKQRAEQYRARIFEGLRAMGYRTIHLSPESRVYRLVTESGAEVDITLFPDVKTDRRKYLTRYYVAPTVGIPMLAYYRPKNQYLTTKNQLYWRSDAGKGWGDASLQYHVKRIHLDVVHHVTGQAVK